MKFPKIKFLILIILLLIAIFCGIKFGSSNISISEFFDSDNSINIIFQLRLLRVLAAFTVGSALAMAGLSYQAVLHNPLAEPFILGVSGGAAIGATLAFVLNLAVLSFWIVPIMAFLGALTALFLVLFISVRSTEKILLSGIIVGTICSSILNCIITFAQNDDLSSITWWMLGNLQAIDPRLLYLGFSITIICAILLYVKSFSTNAIAMGEDYCHNVGVNPLNISLFLIVIGSLLTAMTVALAGIIGFVGLLIPHIMRKIVGADNRILFPFVMFGGALFVIFCDLISRIIYSERELPIGVITSMIGGPVFLWLLNKKFRWGK